MPDANVVPRPAGEPAVDVRRSSRRRRTVSAYRDGDRIVVLIPARFSRAQEGVWVAEMVSRLPSSENVGRRRAARQSDAALKARCRALSDRYLDGQAAPTRARLVQSEPHDAG